MQCDLTVHATDIEGTRLRARLRFIENLCYRVQERLEQYDPNCLHGVLG